MGRAETGVREEKQPQAEGPGAHTGAPNKRGYCMQTVEPEAPAPESPLLWDLFWSLTQLKTPCEEL